MKSSGSSRLMSFRTANAARTTTREMYLRIIFAEMEKEESLPAMYESVEGLPKSGYVI